MAQYLKGRTAYALLKEFSELRKRYLGCHLWGRGYFCSTVGAVTEEIVKNISKTKTTTILASKFGTKRRIYPHSAYLQILNTLLALASTN
jgi:putative transposase